MQDRTWPVIRLVVVLLFGSIVLAGVAIVGWLGVAGGVRGWVPMSMVLAAVGAATGWLAVSRRWARARRVTVLAPAVTCALGGAVMAHFAPPTHDRLRHAIDEIADPRWTLTSDHASGNAACFDYCTAVERAYVIEAGEHAVRTEAAALDLVVGTEDRGDFDLTITVAHQPDGTTRVGVMATT